MPRTQSTILASIALFAAVTLWGSSFVATKIGLQYFEPLSIVWLRQLVATIAILPFWLPAWLRHRHASIRRGDISLLLLLAFFQPCLYFVCESYALQLTTASQAGIVSAMMPLMVAVVAGSLLGEQVTRNMWAGFAVSVCGVVWLTLASAPEESAPSPMLGNLLELAAMACGVGYTIICRKLGARFSPVIITGVQILAGLIFFLPGAFMLPADFLSIVHASLTDTSDAALPLLSISYLGLFVTLGAFGLYNYGVSIIPASRASAWINLVPVVSAILAFLVLGERLSVTQAGGAALVLGGLYLCQKSAPK
ncbi:DMT family transporter [Oleidesulfovibrio sp.]|uniref:DMT family transporter n=1 Tax=Oleidesulfovibrio sp. TaxID=2909707 RepID=UPI003A8C15EF